MYNLSSERVSCLWRAGGHRWEEQQQEQLQQQLEEINRKSLRLIEKLGEGQFGMVCLHNIYCILCSAWYAYSTHICIMFGMVYYTIQYVFYD